MTNFKTMLTIILIILVIVLFFIMYINQYVQISRKSLMVEKLEDEKRQLESKQEHLQLKIAELKSLDRVEKIAKEELNMEQPDNINYIVINPTSDSENLKATSKDQDKEENNKLETKQEKEKLADDLQERMFNWVNDLTTVQAGTLSD
ncbi:MAG: cell division protein FtsL [Bacillota bacterium]